MIWQSEIVFLQMTIRNLEMDTTIKSFYTQRNTREDTILMDIIKEEQPKTII